VLVRGRRALPRKRPRVAHPYHAAPDMHAVRALLAALLVRARNAPDADAPPPVARKLANEPLHAGREMGVRHDANRGKLGGLMQVQSLQDS